MAVLRSKIFWGRSQAALFWIILACLRAWSQEPDLNQIHVLPPAPPSAASVVGNHGLTKSVIKKNVDLVLVPVTITDKMDRVITGLDKQNFKLYENKKEQEIKHFSSEDSPISVGIILDTSGSMKSKIDRAKEALHAFCKTANPQDEFFLITFADQPSSFGGFTSDVEKLQRQLFFVDTHGRTALLDAIYLGLQKMRQAKQPRRALLIISDGGDNRSRYTEHEVMSQVKEADVMIYALGIYDHTFPTEEEFMGPTLLSSIATVSGGRMFSVDDPDDLPVIAEQIGHELRNQYVLGYRPRDTERDGKWHKIKVTLLAPAGFAFLRVRARTGYYAPKQ
jgi:Ca-activated chloride channel family protein